MGNFFDCHVHSCHSHDSRQTLDEICRTALEKGLRGVSVTDHADMWFLEKDHAFQHIAASSAEAKAADERYGERLRVFCGVEISEYRDDPENVAKILTLADYDIVLGSVHSIRFEDWDDSYSRLCFDETVPMEKISRFMRVYFEQVLHVAAHEEFDVLTHLTCPLRYINGRYHREMDLTPYAGLMEEILHCLIRREKALEVNTSGLQAPLGCLMPPEDILRKYHDMGGRLITLASDAHVPERIGNAFPEVIQSLQEIGFQGCCHYERRKPVFHSF